MKTIASLADGKVMLTEEAGVFSLSFDESASIGGGAAAGVVKVAGKGTVQLDSLAAIHLGEALLNSKLPEAVKPIAEMVEGVAEKAIGAVI